MDLQYAHQDQQKVAMKVEPERHPFLAIGIITIIILSTFFI